MESARSGLVDIVRDFLRAHRALREVAAHQRRGELGFDEVRALVGDGEEAVLFRLKERSHALFRERADDPGETLDPGVLFDLAVGSLFHEAMKLRENYYQRASYGPKVRALREASVRDSTGLLHEFEKILQGSALRLEESLEEVETLLGQTTAQFRLLLAARASCGVVTRYLVENAALVEEALGEDLDAVLAAIHGSAGAGHARAARSYLESGFFAEARERALAAAERGEEPEVLRRMARYAEGMQCYLEGRFGEAVDGLAGWLDAGPEADAQALRLALAVVSRVGQLVEPGPGGAAADEPGTEAGDRVALEAAALAERLRGRLGPASAAAR